MAALFQYFHGLISHFQASSGSGILSIGITVAAVAAAGWYFKKKRDESNPPKTLLDPNAKYALKLIRKDEISRDTRYAVT